MSVDWIPWIYLIGFSLIIGSFLNVVIYRVPEGLSIVRPGSRCPHCETPVAARDNVPVLSYVLLRGRCRHCREPISPVYPAVELGTAAVAALTFWRIGLQPALMPYLLMTYVLVAVTVIDLQTFLIPDVITLPGTAFLLAMAGLGWLWPGLGWPISALDALLGAASGWLVVFGIIGVYWLMTREFGMGGGDLKFLAMVGALLGVGGVLMTLMLASFVGTAVCLPFMALGRLGRKSPVPFGPFLAVGTYVSMLFGQDLIVAYQHFLGAR